MQKELNEITAKRQKKGKVAEEKTVEEKTTLHVKDPTDYQASHVNTGGLAFVFSQYSIYVISNKPPRTITATANILSRVGRTCTFRKMLGSTSSRTHPRTNATCRRSTSTHGLAIQRPCRRSSSFPNQGICYCPHPWTAKSR